MLEDDPCSVGQTVFGRCDLVSRKVVCFFDVPHFLKPFLLCFRSLGLTRKNNETYYVKSKHIILKSRLLLIANKTF